MDKFDPPDDDKKPWRNEWFAEENWALEIEPIESSRPVEGKSTPVGGGTDLLSEFAFGLDDEEDEEDEPLTTTSSSTVSGPSSSSSGPVLPQPTKKEKVNRITSVKLARRRGDAIGLAKFVKGAKVQEEKESLEEHKETEQEEV